MITRIIEENKEMKNHMSKLTKALAVGEHEKFPAQAQPNSNGQHMAQTLCSGENNPKKMNAITTRFGKVIEPIPKPRKNEKESSESGKSSPSDEVVGNPSRVSFPQAPKLTPKSVNLHSEILEYLWQVKINLSPLHVISQVPTYAKILKYLCIVKRRHNVKKITFLIEQVSAVIEKRIPPKYKDLDCLGEIKPTFVFLQLADRSIISPRGVVEDKLSFGNMTLEVNIFHITKQPTENDECHHTYMIEALTQEEASATADFNPLKLFLLNSAIPASLNNEEYANVCAVFAKFQDYGTSTWQPEFEELLEKMERQQP
ncbi:uncharacterized protein LOC111383355 [Olea europaea var. sylvestris]|uniref:uncharacterized protein LOC111383355 n=1 Tax=Olea europaea var. sylvestris TaxID=158386 RepID=UPI000C1CDCE1|nr:uncharacterized protein LOC111383355 [Olea europaea var. sylvestris]